MLVEYVFFMLVVYVLLMYAWWWPLFSLCFRVEFDDVVGGMCLS